MGLLFYKWPVRNLEIELHRTFTPWLYISECGYTVVQIGWLLLEWEND